MVNSNDIVEMPDLSWMDETVERLEKNNWLYKFACLFLFRPKKKLKYKEMYMILSRLNEKHLGKENADRAALIEIINIYNFNNNTKNMLITDDDK